MTRHRDAPLTDLLIDAFLMCQKTKAAFMRGTDTMRMAWRILWRLYYDRRDLRRENAALKARIAELTGASGETNWTGKVAER
jgi:hypothetical protein